MLGRSIKYMMPLPKIIVIAGTTGVGKSQLSIELATRFNGEIINSDAMQVYKDAPIITNKHPLEERNGIPHHIINYVDWDQEYDIHRFETDTNVVIEDILKRGKLPIIVGGTHYYLQFLFDKFITTGEQLDDINKRQISLEEQNILDNADKFQRFEQLTKIDPVIASRYHPNDTKRVHRLLEIYYTTGQKPSELFAKQEKKLRYDTLFLWLYSDPTELNKRLDTRVDDMVKSGALEEIKQLYNYYRTQQNPNDHGGIWQVIGFKEFLPWLKSEQKKDDELWNEGVKRMKLHTRQYARRQVKWIQKMLIPDIQGDIYVLDATHLSKWHQLAGERAAHIADLFLHNNNNNNHRDNAETKTNLEFARRAPKNLLQLISTEQTVGKKRGISEDDCKHFTCDICKDQNDVKLIAIGVKQWETHLKSRRHKGNLTRGNKKAAYEKWKAQQEENV